jgi:hypothetical protein
MTNQDMTVAAAPVTVSTVRPAYFVAAAVALIVMSIAITGESIWFLTFVHVMAGILWTGIDLFMGFVVGPVLRRLPFETRRAMIGLLVPRTLLLMPTLAIITGTSGWFLARRLGYFDLGYPEFYWVMAALIIVTILAIQGLGYLLPTNYRVYREMQKPKPDGDKIGRWMRGYVRAVAFQGLMQIVMIVIMARFGSGL